MTDYVKAGKFVTDSYALNSTQFSLDGTTLQLGALESVGTFALSLLSPTDCNARIQIKTTTAGKTGGIDFYDAGTAYFSLSKNTTNNLVIYDTVNAKNRLLVSTSTGDVLFQSSANGNVGIGATSATISDGIGLHITGKILRIGTAKTPDSSGATGNVGEICWDASFLYCCTATNTWERVGIATW